ncbi:MAG: hypothetical protein A2Y10_12370 [Planctomycetes bacterium GWF2_41_51]|nr:MAG: hypothetical protein A2Y10_12370 [Planctomycetes bacterium GWF2_41_51]HBG27217.1 hypothetical protein [Phycisphaerales bacterium]
MQKEESAKNGSDFNGIFQIDKTQAKNHLGTLVRNSVEEILNDMLETEAQALCNAGRYERSEARKNNRAGHYKRKLHTAAGEVELNMPKLRYAKFETAIIERYKRRESSVEEALMEMYLAGVSVRRVEDVTEALWGMRVNAAQSASLISRCMKR